MELTPRQRFIAALEHQPLLGNVNSGLLDTGKDDEVIGLVR